MQHRLIISVFLLFCTLGHLALAAIQQTCTSELEANSVLTKSKVTIKKGITYPWKELDKGVASLWTDCNKQMDCFTELVKPPYEFKAATLKEHKKNGTTGNTWHQYICIPLGKGFNGTLQVNMMYHCEDAVNGKEITATKVQIDNSNTAKPVKHLIPFTCK